MSREIKFRGKRINKNEWVYGYLLGTEDQMWIAEGYYKTHYEVIPETVGQQVGNIFYQGDEIPFFEGDIAQDIYREQIGVVTFDYDKWVIISKNRPIYIGSCSDWIKVGTVHDNPELLTTP